MKEIVENLLAKAGITINGSNPWDLRVHNDQFYKRLLTNTELALGEAYMDHWWDCQSLDQFFHRVIAFRLEKQIQSHYKFWRNTLALKIMAVLARIFNYQTKEESLQVGKQHYDIGNDLYQIMLDKRLVYTCGYWEDAKDLDEAQDNKLKLVCEKLYLKPGMKVLDIGCGFGSFAKYAAEHYGVSVVGVTISEQQVLFGRKLCGQLPVELRFQDYRDLLKENVQYDRIVSLGMFEHVGHKNYKQYMQVAAHCLKEDGLFLLHTIGANRSNLATTRWINTYIFPHGQIPSITQIGKACEDIFVIEDWHNFGIHYDKTLMAWYRNFNQGWDKLKHKYDTRFRRMWNYYLLSCAGSFRARNNQLWQIVLSKKGLPDGYKRI